MPGEFFITAGGQKNRKYIEGKCSFNKIDEALVEILFDPQTSGGLLISVSEKDMEKMMEEMNTLPIKPVFIGRVIEKEEKILIIK